MLYRFAKCKLANLNFYYRGTSPYCSHILACLEAAEATGLLPQVLNVMLYKSGFFFLMMRSLKMAPFGMCRSQCAASRRQWPRAYRCVPCTVQRPLAYTVQACTVLRCARVCTGDVIDFFVFVCA